MTACSFGCTNRTPPDPPSFSLSDPRLAALFDMHNTVRMNAVPTPNPPLPLMVWSEELAEHAADWANNCIMAHADNLGELGEGENWTAWSAAGNLPGEDVVIGWADEAADYNYADNSCSGVCGHYTQVVWRTSTELGCAVQACPFGLTNWDDGREIWICRYREPGNWSGEWPY